VLYRLHQHHHAAYLVGGSVRDLMLGRRPKDFDVGTDAHPYQIKRLFRNCWIIGRRFRLAHIKFGEKTIEVATFRKHVVADAATENPEAPAADDQSVVVAASTPAAPASADHFVHRDNTFGTPEEDAFRRDFTINGLFYDIATHSVIDYVGGLEDLQRRVIRSIGDPHVRFVEDPVRMFRAAVFAARLGFDMDELVLEAIARHRELILKASPARLMEEYYKILRSGHAEASFRALQRVRLLELLTPDLRAPRPEVWESLARLDAYRQRFPTLPKELTNTVLAGSLVVPMGALAARPDPAASDQRVSFGVLMIAKRDLERLRQLLQVVPRLTDPDLPPRVVRSLTHRPAFPDALTWMSIFSDAPAELVEHWKHQYQHRSHAHPHGHGQAHGAAPESAHAAAGQPSDQPRKRRRRRRRGRRRSGSGSPGNSGTPAS
jgi:poly(A) polymerase